METLQNLDVMNILDGMKKDLADHGLLENVNEIIDNIPSLTPVTDFIDKEHSHDVEFFWNYWPLYYILWPIGIPLNVVLFPFFFLQLPF